MKINIEKPFPSEHAARLTDPKKYKGNFARQNNKGGPGIDFIFGVLPGGKTELQTIRFDSKKHTVEQAKKWLKDHDHKTILFEPATNKSVSKKNFETSENNDHTHTADLDAEGNGNTDTADNHSHRIARFVVNEAEGHTHKILNAPKRENPKLKKLSDGVLVKCFQAIAKDYEEKKKKDSFDIDVLKDAIDTINEIETREDIQINLDKFPLPCIELYEIAKGERDIRTVCNGNMFIGNMRLSKDGSKSVELNLKVLDKLATDIPGLCLYELACPVDSNKPRDDVDNIRKAVEFESLDSDLKTGDIVKCLTDKVNVKKENKEILISLENIEVIEKIESKAKVDYVSYIIKQAKDKITGEEEVINDLKKTGWMEDDGNSINMDKEISIIKSDRLLKEGKVLGVVYEPDTVDLQNEYATAEEIEKACHKFMEDNAELNFMHRKSLSNRDAVIIENYIVRAAFEEGGQTIKKGSWVLGIKVNNPNLKKMIENGVINAFSMEGKATRGKPIPEIERQAA